MTELFEAAFSTFNIIPTVILLFVLMYWVLVILGAMDISTFDFDLDIDADADLDMDVDGAADGDISYLNYILKFFNIDKLPLMVFMTCWIVPVWMVSVLGNHYLGNTSFLFSLVILLPAMFGSLFIAKVLTFPFVKFFDKLEDQADSEKDIIGHEVTVVMTARDSQMGQAEIFYNNNSLRVNIKTKTGEITKGSKALITSFEQENNCYIVEPHFTID